MTRSWWKWRNHTGRIPTVMATTTEEQHMNLSVLPDLRAAERPLGAAVDDTADLNNSQFLDVVRRAAAVLSAQRVAAGDVVAPMLPNTASFVVGAQLDEPLDWMQQRLAAAQ